MPHSPNPKPGPSDANVDRAALLREAVEHSVRAQQEAARPVVIKRSRARTITTALLCAALLALCAWSLIARPEFIWGPRQVAAIPAERAEASVRFAMYLMARRAEAYHAREGEYPATAQEISADTSLAYTRLDASRFQITARVGGKQLVLSSADDPSKFVGNSAQLIQQRIGK